MWSSGSATVQSWEIQLEEMQGYKLKRQIPLTLAEVDAKEDGVCEYCAEDARRVGSTTDALACASCQRYFHLHCAAAVAAATGSRARASTLRAALHPHAPNTPGEPCPGAASGGRTTAGERMRARCGRGQHVAVPRVLRGRGGRPQGNRGCGDMGHSRVGRVPGKSRWGEFPDKRRGRPREDMGGKAAGGRAPQPSHAHVDRGGRSPAAGTLRCARRNGRAYAHPRIRNTI